MKNKIPIILSVFSVIVLCITPFIMLTFEKEFVEAIIGGIVIGSVIGSVLGILAIMLNKRKKKIIYIFSTIPMFPLIIFLLMAIPYYLFN